MPAEQDAMKRMIHALAAMGAALVFGCAGAETEPAPVDRIEPDGALSSSKPAQPEQDITAGGRYVWGYNSHGEYTIQEIDGEPVPDHIDHDVWYANRAKTAGITVEQLKAQIADAVAPMYASGFNQTGVLDDVSADGLQMPEPGAPIEKASAHPAYRYGILGMGTTFDFNRGTNTGMSSCTCTGQGGTVSGPHPSAQITYSCKEALSGDHTTNACMFPRSKNWTYYMGDNARWGGFLTYFRARMVEAILTWHDNFTFTETFTAPTGSSHNVVEVYPGNGTNNASWFGHMQFLGVARDEGDLPIRNAQAQHDAKAISYDLIGLDISTDRLERYSDSKQRAAGLIPPFDFANAYANIMAHELGHLRGLPHFTNAPAGMAGIPLMVPGCAGVQLMLPRSTGGIRGDSSFFDASTSELNVNSSGNAEGPLGVGYLGPYAFTNSATNICPTSTGAAGAQFDIGTPE